MKIHDYGERLASLDEAIEARYFIIEQELRLLWRTAMADEAFLLKQEPRLRLIIDGLAEIRGLPGAKLPYYLNEVLRRLQGKTLNGMPAETWKGLHIESKIRATIASQLQSDPNLTEISTSGYTPSKYGIWNYSSMNLFTLNETVSKRSAVSVHFMNDGETSFRVGQ